jgi:hypothetical protein
VVHAQGTELVVATTHTHPPHGDVGGELGHGRLATQLIPAGGGRCGSDGAPGRRPARTGAAGMPGLLLRGHPLLLLAPCLLATTCRPALMQAVTGDTCSKHGCLSEPCCGSRGAGGAGCRTSPACRRRARLPHGAQAHSPMVTGCPAWKEGRAARSARLERRTAASCAAAAFFLARLLAAAAAGLTTPQQWQADGPVCGGEGGWIAGGGGGSRAGPAGRRGGGGLRQRWCAAPVAATAPPQMRTLTPASHGCSHTGCWGAATSPPLEMLACASAKTHKIRGYTRGGRLQQALV